MEKAIYQTVSFCGWWCLVPCDAVRVIEIEYVFLRTGLEGCLMSIFSIGSFTMSIQRQLLLHFTSQDAMSCR